MTQIRYRVAPGVLSIVGEPSRRRVDGRGVLLPVPRTVAELVDGEGMGELDHTLDWRGDEAWFWKLTEVASTGITPLCRGPGHDRRRRLHGAGRRRPGRLLTVSDCPGRTMLRWL